MSAVISACGKYRYTLDRQWGPANDAQCDKGMLLWVMLNPSTADAEKDDNTIRRCINYSKAWGYSGLMVGNLYAFRATNPIDMFDAKDPVGPDNDRWIDVMAKHSERIIAAWGGAGSSHRRDAVLDRLRRFGVVYSLGTTVDGSPRHPLYLKKWLLPRVYAPIHEHRGAA